MQAFSVVECVKQNQYHNKFLQLTIRKKRLGGHFKHLVITFVIWTDSQMRQSHMQRSPHAFVYTHSSFCRIYMLYAPYANNDFNISALVQTLSNA